MTGMQVHISGWGVPACRFEILQFVAKFATGRNLKKHEGTGLSNGKDS